MEMTLHGVLTRAGTFPVREQEVTGFLVETPVANLAAVPRLPMYLPVTLVEQPVWDAALDMKREVGELTQFISQTYPKFAGMKSTRCAIDEIKRLRGVLQSIADEAVEHHEYNPISGVTRLPQGYTTILNLAITALE